MLPNDPTSWTAHFRHTLARYDEALLRRVAAHLVRPRNQWPAEELIERCASAVTNVAVIDRRLQTLAPPGRRLLAFMGHSRQPRWRLGSLLELLACAGHAEGPGPALALFEAGLLYPDLPEGISRLKSFEQWLGQAGPTAFPVVIHPLVAARAVGVDLGLPDLEDKETRRQGDKEIAGADVTSVSLSPGLLVSLSGQEADGLEWPLRLAVLWQQVSAAPLRRTQQGDFFKRDFERLRGDPLLTSQSGSGLTELPDAGLLAVALALELGIVEEHDGELRAAPSATIPGDGPADQLAALWAALLRVEPWDPLEGWRAGTESGNPYASVYLLALLLLARLPEGAWVAPPALEAWIVDHHPRWAPVASRNKGKGIGLPAFLLGLAYDLRLVQAARQPGGNWLVRLSPGGRWLLAVGDPPAPAADFPQTLLVQPNLEIVAYRQGLTPGLIGRLGRFAVWKGLGAACTLQIEPHSVYRALESGLTFEEVVQTLERHGTRALPVGVLELLRTWANKRDRITIFPAAALLEFDSARELNEALARGLPGVRVTDQLAAVPAEADIDFRHFRLTGTRDYTLPPERCIEVGPDGVTLTIDASRSDLLLDCELPRFAEPLQDLSRNGRRCYQLTPTSLAAARASGLGLPALETWFAQRAGRPLPPAVRLLLTAVEAPAPELKRCLVLEVVDEELADGLMQWPATRALIEARLGPTALVVTEEHVEPLREQLRALGMRS